MTLSIIVAATRDMAIGHAGDQLYYFRDDLKHFKALTTGHPVMMGRKTFEALPRGPLPNRRNIVISRDPALVIEGAETATSVEAALGLLPDDSEPFVIGGGEIYRQALPLADKVYMTLIDAEAPHAEVRFPRLDPSEWMLAEESEPVTDAPTGISFTFLRYDRRR